MQQCSRHFDRFLVPNRIMVFSYSFGVILRIKNLDLLYRVKKSVKMPQILEKSLFRIKLTTFQKRVKSLPGTNFPIEFAPSFKILSRKFQKTLKSILLIFLRLSQPFTFSTQSVSINRIPIRVAPSSSFSLVSSGFLSPSFFNL